MHRPLVVLALAALVVPGTGCLHGGETARTPAGATRGGDVQARSGVVKVSRRDSVAVPYVTGDRAYGLVRGRSEPVRLGGGVVSTFIATLGPAAVLDPAGRRLAYNSWRGEGPAIRLHELSTGEDELLDVGAFSVAWRSDGALASFKGRRAEIDLRRERPRGHVVVRRGPGARPVRWTARPGHYVVAAWAADRLLAYRVERARGAWPDLLVFDRAGRQRVLARDSGLVALSPDGRRAFVTAYGAAAPLVRVLDVARGAEHARLRLPARDVEWVTESGSWTGELVTAKASPGVLVFRVGDTRIAVEQVLRFQPGRYPLGVFEPRSDPSGRRIALWAQHAQEPRQPVPQAAVLDCDRFTQRCVEGPPVSTGREPRLVYDPSRP